VGLNHSSASRSKHFFAFCVVNVSSWERKCNCILDPCIRS